MSNKVKMRDPMGNVVLLPAGSKLKKGWSLVEDAPLKAPVRREVTTPGPAPGPAPAPWFKEPATKE